MAVRAGPYANPYFVQFEMPHEYTAASFANQLGNAAYYTAYILKQNNLPVTKGTKDGGGTVWTHAMISSYLGGTDHEDPISYWSTMARKLFGTTYNINKANLFFYRVPIKKPNYGINYNKDKRENSKIKPSQWEPTA